jgi:endoglucanase
MHRPDGVPDTVQQVKHGALLILAQFHNIGHAIRGTHEPDLRQYTQVGDGASKTDGRLYDLKLGPNEVKGDYSGKADDRWIFTTNNPYFQWNAIATLAAAADTLKGWDDALAKDCLQTAIKAWNDAKANPMQYPADIGLHGEAPAGAAGGGVLAGSQGVVSQGNRNGRNSSGVPASSDTPSPQPAPPAGFGRGGFAVGLDWAAALELTVATNGAEPYKSRLKELSPRMITPQQMDLRGWTAVRALSYLDASAKDQMRYAVKTYMAGLDERLDCTPFGVPPSLGTWGRCCMRVHRACCTDQCEAAI